MYNNFYYAELLILIPLLLSAVLLRSALNIKLNDSDRSLNAMLSIFFGVVFFIVLFGSGGGLPNSADTNQVVEFLRKADKNDVDVVYFGMYSKIKYRDKVVFPGAVRRPVINYFDQQEKAQVNELIKEVIFD